MAWGGLRVWASGSTRTQASRTRRRLQRACQARRWRRRVFRAAALVASLLLAGWVAFSAVNGMLRSNVVEARIADTQAEIDELRRDADKLAALVAWLESDAYVEWSAREDLGLVRRARRRSRCARRDARVWRSRARPGGPTCCRRAPSIEHGSAGST